MLSAMQSDSRKDSIGQYSGVFRLRSKRDRDKNAAVNILRLGLQSVGVKTVEAHGI